MKIFKSLVRQVDQPGPGSEQTSVKRLAYESSKCEKSKQSRVYWLIC